MAHPKSKFRYFVVELIHENNFPLFRYQTETRDSATNHARESAIANTGKTYAVLERDFSGWEASNPTLKEVQF